MQNQKLCLKWNNHMSNMLSLLGSFQQKDMLVDVTISCQGQNIKAHKVILSACSQYFQNIFMENPCQHPIIIINGMKFEDVSAILNFMYKGEVNVSQDGLSSFLQAAEALKVKGLAEVCGEKKGTNSISQEVQPSELNRPQRTDTPPRKRPRNRKRSLSDSNRSDDEGLTRKHREPSSPEVHELSGDESFTGDNSSNGPPFNSVPRVPHNVYSHSRSHQSSNIADEDEEYDVESNKMLDTSDSNVSMNNNADNNLRIERIMGNTEIESSSLQEPESPPDIKPIISYGESSAGTSESGAMMLYNEQSQPGPSNAQDGSLLHDNSHTQGMKILPKTDAPQPLKLNNILFPVTLPTMPQLFLINSGVWEQQSDIEIVQEQMADNIQVKDEPQEDTEEPFPFLNTPRYDVISNDTPLPEFSETVRQHLDANDVSAVWGTFIDECARHYYSKFPNIQNSSEYQTIGRKMYATYPTISYAGKEPWSFFCKCLSQKIRHIKWKIKRKKLGFLPPPSTTRKTRETINFKLRSVRRKVDHRYTPSKLYRALLKELREGLNNKSISEYRILDILKQTNKGRRTWLESLQRRKLSSLVAEYPCFKDPKYIVEDFLYTINHEDTSLMVERFESLFSAVGAVMKPPIKSKNFLQYIEILKYLEDEISFEKGRRTFSKSIVIHKLNIPEDQRLQQIESPDDSFPVVYVFSNGETIEKMYVVGDNTIIDINSTELLEALVILMATYYTFGIEYPKSFSQILGLFQIYVVGDSFDGVKSHKFRLFMKTLNNFFDIGEPL